MIVMVTLDPAGLVTRADVTKSGGSDFDRVALKAIWSSKFEAAVRDGRRVPTRFPYSAEFRLPPE